MLAKSVRTLLHKHFDYVVIGGGAAGCVVASQLATRLPEAKILLVEAGPEPLSSTLEVPLLAAAVIPGDVPRLWNYNWAFHGEPNNLHQQSKKPFIPRGCCLGGSTAINAMLYIRGHPRDYDEWNDVAPGWSYQDVLPVFKRLEKNSRGRSQAHGADGQLSVTDTTQDNLNLEMNQAFVQACKDYGMVANGDFNNVRSTEGYGPYQQTRFPNGRRCTSFSAFLEPLTEHRLKHSNLTILSQTMAMQLEVDKNTIGMGRARVTGVRLQDRTKNGHVVGIFEEITVKASKEVILCGGAIQTPQLLLCSGIGPRKKLDAADVPITKVLRGVGENLQEHLDIVVPFRTAHYTPSRSFSPRNAPFLFKQWKQYRKDGGGVWQNIVEYGAFAKSSKELYRPDIQFHFVPCPIVDHGRKRKLWDGYSLHACNLYPTSRGSIRIKNGKASAKPIIDMNFLATKQDQDVMRKALDMTLALASPEHGAKSFEYLKAKIQPPFTGISKDIGNPIQTINAKDEAIRKNADGVYHPVGTCAMGTSTDSVVDPTLQVHGMEGLRIADASIMPTIVGGNTAAPCMMIGARCVDFIMEKISKEAKFGSKK